MMFVVDEESGRVCNEIVCGKGDDNIWEVVLELSFVDWFRCICVVICVY